MSGADIEIIRRRDIAYVHGRTKLGEEWLKKNTLYMGPYLTITWDVVEDFIVHVEEEDLVVEIK